jgi:hydroxymethylglutaryl-CoA synthase
MIGIAGSSVYIPKNRIKLSDISTAWKKTSGDGEIAVASPDEDVFTLGFKAASNAIIHAAIKSEEIGSVSFCTTTSPYVERSFGSSLAYGIGATHARVADFGFSLRSTTSAILAAIDSVKSGIGKYALVVASDSLTGKPGTEAEMVMGAGASACIVASDKVIAEVEGSYSYSTDFPDRWRKTSELYAKSESGRYVREHGYSSHVTHAVQGLMSRLKIESKDFNYAILQPMFDWDIRALRPMGFTASQRRGNLTKWFGETGCASVLIELTSLLDEAKPGERILLVSYGSGGSDALSLICHNTASPTDAKSSVRYYTEDKHYLNYAELLEHRNAFKE